MKSILFLVLVFISSLVIVSEGQDCECGVRGVGGGQCTRSGRLVGGSDVKLGEFPWVALLVSRKPGSRVRRCGGTLLNDR